MSSFRTFYRPPRTPSSICDVESHGLEEDVVGICGHIFGHQDHVFIGIAVQNGPALSVLQSHLLNQLVHFVRKVFSTVYGL